MIRTHTRKPAESDPRQTDLFASQRPVNRPVAIPHIRQTPLQPDQKRELERLQSQLKRTTQMHFQFLRSSMRDNPRLNAMNGPWKKIADDFRLERKWPTVDQFQQLGHRIEGEEVRLAAFYARALSLLGELDAALAHQNLGFYHMLMHQWAVKPVGSAEQYVGNYLLLRIR